MAIKKFLKLMLFSAVIIAAFVFTCFASAAESRETVFTAVNGYNDRTTEITVQYNDSIEFTGSVIDTGIKVYAGTGPSKRLLTRGEDYDIGYTKGYRWYEDLVYPGSYSAEIDLEDYYDYECELDISVFYSSDKLKLADIPSFTYSGDDYEPEIKVYYGSTLLSDDFYYAEYERDFDDDYDFDDDVCVGTYCVYVEMRSEFDSKVLRTSYEIYPAPADKVAITGIGNYTYCGEEICPEPEITYCGKKLYEYYDYSLSYADNENAGTAKVTIKFKNNFTGSKTVNFKIAKLSASKISVFPIANQDYTGKAVKPYVEVDSIGWEDFYQGDDFTVSYSNNVNIGTAKATLKFKNKNISGSKTVEFKITVGNIEADGSSVNSNYVELNWYCYHDYLFKVYKYDSSKKQYVYLKTTKKCNFIDKSVKEFKTYKYRVRACVKIDEKTYNGAYVYFTVKTKLFSPQKVKLSVSKGKNTVSWGKKSNANGYYVYRYDDNKGTYKRIYTAKSKNTTKYIDKAVKNYGNYTYWVVAYKKDGNKTVKSARSEYVGNLDPSVIANCVKLKPKTSYKVYNAQGSKTVHSGTVTLSKKDIKTLDKFAKKHFKSGWSNYDKVRYTLLWIHNNVKYAKASKDWNKISGKSYVDAIFNYKLGQCAQYNGALAAMMTHMGYDVQLIRGYRYYNSQHFWTECKINGLTYVMECGNKKDGAWYYIFEPYKYTNGYTKNGKMMS